MKQIYFLFSALLLCSLTRAQSPTIYGSFLPVNGTAVKEVWDTATNVLPMPASGSGVTWDYSLNYVGSDTFQLSTVPPASGPSGTTFPTATNGAFVRAIPKYETVDSLFLYYRLNYNGLYNIGTVNEKKAFNNAVYTAVRAELVTPFEFNSSTPVTYDTSIQVAYFNYTIPSYGTFPVKHVHTQYKIMSYEGYGTLKIPGVTYTNVVMTNELVTELDTFYVNVLGTYQYYPAYVPASETDFSRCEFLRNNTFATSVLMYLQDDDFDGNANAAWYTLPVAFGSISGTALDSSGKSALTKGKNQVLLFRDHSNFMRDDILDYTVTDLNGNYQFDSIPYGYYRVAVIPDTTQYPNSVTTYYGDTVAGSPATWMHSDSINTINCRCNATGNNIKIKYHAPQSNAVSLSGSITTTFPYENPFMAPLDPMRKSGSRKNKNLVMASNDVKGIDIVVKKKPSGSLAVKSSTDSSGNFSFNNLDPGNYTMIVDMPGISSSGSYSFTVSSGSSINCLSYTIFPDSINPDNTLCGPLSAADFNSGHFSARVYPNPWSAETRIGIELPSNSFVLIDLYDNLGQKITTVENACKASGSYQYAIQQDNLPSSGIYLLRVSANNSTQTIKIIKE